MASAGATAERAAKPPTVGGKIGSALRGCAHSHKRDSLSLVPDEYHGVVFEYTDFMQKRPQGRPHASLPPTDDYCGLQETFSDHVRVYFTIGGMH